jgi:UDP-N-acetylmuramate--alanine ligase
VALEFGVRDEDMRLALAQFKGVGRRLQHWGEVQIHGEPIDLVDDYGHHPVEIEATLSAVRGAFPGRRLVLAFQPHRYSRTRDLFDDFVRVLSQGPDLLVLTEIYAAGEQPIPAADGRSLARAIRQLGRIDPVLIDSPDQLPEALCAVCRRGDVLVTMGAGSIGATPSRLLSLQKAQGDVCRP